MPSFGLPPPVSAEVEYDCGNQTICEPAQDAYLGCSFGDNWGDLTSSTNTNYNTNPVSGRTQATAAPVGGSNFDRWIITSCSSVTFRPYATATTTASTTHCDPNDINYNVPCAGISAAWVTNTAGSGSGDEQYAFCGAPSCDLTVVGQVDHQVSGIDVDQPGNKRVVVWGDATAKYYADYGGQNQCVLCAESLDHQKHDSEPVTFWIGSTPPL